MIQQPSRYTLFPYTTLFRSNRSMELRIIVLPGDGVGPEVTEQAVRVLREVASLYGHKFLFEEHLVGGDRKSTRLNSSHRCISYAVFCLKKKIPAAVVLQHVR